MIKAAVLGSPIVYSLSPKLHRKAFEVLKIVGSYEALEVDEQQLDAFFEANRDLDWSGFSLTMPLKEQVVKIAPNVSEIAKRTNSANTLYRSGGDWSVTSTDYLAFENLLDVAQSSRVAVIGGGGTARAAIGSLDAKVAKLDVFLRNPLRQAAILAAAPNCEINFLEMNAPIAQYDLIIQTTPAGVFDEFSQGAAKADAVLMECIYQPWPTKLAANFLAKGLKVISGKDLLVEQALFQVELFTSAKVDFEKMRSILKAELAS